MLLNVRVLGICIGQVHNASPHASQTIFFMVYVCSLWNLRRKGVPYGTSDTIQ